MTETRRSDMDTGAPRTAGDDGGQSDWVDCPKCKDRHQLRFTTKAGMLVQLPLECGGKGLAPKRFKALKRCANPDCGAAVKSVNTWCAPCRRAKDRIVSRTSDRAYKVVRSLNRMQREVGE